MPDGRIVIQKGKAKPFWYRHPWVFSGAVEAVEGEPADGDVVEVVDVEGKRIGRGFYHSKSKIRVRLMAHGDEEVGPDLIRTRLRAAIALRRDTLGLGNAETDGYRWVHGEGDGLPGLVVDRYADFLVVQFGVLGMRRYDGEVFRLLEEELRPRGIVENSMGLYGETEGIPRVREPRWGEPPPNPVLFRENGFVFEADLLKGQKTGYYFDQRENRRLVGSIAGGRRTLDLFTYSGAFAFAAARGGATSVTAVDSSAAALEASRRNAERNGLGEKVDFVDGDVSEFLRVAKQDPYDLIVLDPPRLAPHKKDVDRAVLKYRELNLLAFLALKPGGILASSSCSGPLQETDLEDILARTAREANRRVQVFHRGSQGPDHPVDVACPESRYLKFFLCRAL
jgi:23S rRNA (cytosine1962-C5)-methyltransferase